MKGDLVGEPGIRNILQIEMLISVPLLHYTLIYVTNTGSTYE